jgi:hypothetical protein
VFQVDFDFVSHHLEVRTSDGDTGGFQLRPQTVAAFYRQFMEELARLGITVKIHSRPNEVPEAVPFAQDHVHNSYDAESVTRYWRALVQADRVFKEFRARFAGKSSPVHYYWGAPDLAVTRFSGRTAPQHPGGVPNLPDRIAREAYSHEVSSCGFWAGGGAVDYPAFYAYAYPQPDGFADAVVSPTDAFYSTDLGEFVLPYEVVRESPDPDQTLLDFLQTTYEAAAVSGRWDRGSLERTHDPRHSA